MTLLIRWACVVQKYRIKHYYDKRYKREIWMPQVRSCLWFWTNMVYLSEPNYDMFIGYKETKSEKSAMEYLKEYHKINTRTQEHLGIKTKITEVNIEDLL